MEFAKYLIDFTVYAVLGLGISWYFFYFRRLDLFGGFIGAAVVALIGAILGAFLLQNILQKVIEFLQRGFFISNVNVIAALLGGILSIFLLSKINDGKRRQDY